MPKTFGILAAADTGLTSYGELSNFSRTGTAEVAYGTDVNGEPDSDDGGRLQPQTISFTMEVTGSPPAAKDVVTINLVNYIVTSVGEVYEVGAAYKIDCEATLQKTI